MGPTVVLDAGDLLFPAADVTPAGADLARAELLLEAAGAFETAALGIGDRDLANGVEWLLERAKKAKVPLVSANLAMAGGEKPFEARRLVSVGGVKIGVTGLWLSNVLPPPTGFVAADPVETARAEAKALKSAGADLVVVLAHGPPNGARAVAEVEGVDLVIPSHTGPATTPQKAGSGYVIGAGREGRSVLKVDLSLGTSGPLVDSAAADRKRREIASMNAAIERGEKLLQGAKTAEEKAARARTLADYRTSLDTMKAELAAPVPPDARTFLSQEKLLGQGAPEDPVWAEKVRRLEEKYPAPPH